MTSRIFQRYFENFLGEDLRSTDLTTSTNFAKELTNYQFAEGQSIKGTPGFQIIAPPGSFLGVHTYNFTNPNNGATQSELLAVNDTLWKLSSAQLDVTGGSNMNHTIRVNSGTSTFRAVLNSGSTPYTFTGNPYIDLGTGFEDLPVTIEDLRAAIDAHATLACALPAGIKFARVNGLQALVTSITVDAGHNYVVNDVMTFFDYNSVKLVQKRVTATTGTTITFDSIYAGVTVKDNQVIGPMASPAAGVPIADAYTSTAGGVALQFFYWTPIAYTSDAFRSGTEPFRALWESRDQVGYTHPCFINSSNVCYIHSPATMFSGIQYTLGAHDGYPHKYDGAAVYRESLGKANTPILGATSGGVLTGIYKWKYQCIFEDAKGNVIEGQVSDVPAQATLAAQQQLLSFASAQLGDAAQIGTVNGNQVAVTTITVFAGHTVKLDDTVGFYDSAVGAMTVRMVTATSATTITISGAAVNVNNLDGILFSKYLGMRYDGAVVNGLQTNVNTVTVFGSTVTGSPNRVRVGDKIYFFNSKISALDSRTVTAVTATTVTFNGDLASFANLTVISSGIYLKIWRTKAGGNLYYLSYKLANEYRGIFTTGDTVGGTFIDNKADTALGERLIDNEIGLEADISPRSRFAVIHQGTKVASGIDTDPNTVAIYSSLNFEAVPLASNYFDVPSSSQGGITAIASDNDDRLAVFKPNSYYDVTGYLEDLAFSVRTAQEGDYGVASHASIKKIGSKIVGVGKLGLVSVQDGQLSPLIGSSISPLFLNNTNVNYLTAIAINDYTMESYELYVPPTLSFTSDASLTNQIQYSLDYKNNNAWFRRSLPASIEPSGGFAIYQDVLFILSKSFGTGSRAANPGTVYRRISNVTTESLKYSFNHQAPTFRIRTAWEHLNKPSSYKQYIEMRVFSLPSQYEGKTSFTLACDVYRNFYESTSDGVSPSYVFNGSTDFEKTNKLKTLKSRAVQFVLTTSGVGTCPFISGLELVVTPSYDEDGLAT